MGAATERVQEGAEPKARVFISYSRKDMAFVDRLEAALRARGFVPLVDRTEIYAFEDWWKRIEALVGRADTVVFVLSPDAVASDVALKEVAHAASLNKRFAPIVCRRVEDGAIPEALRRLNFVFFDDPERFEASADQLAEALRTDIGWIRRHTEYGEAARRWATGGRLNGLLLRSPMLEEAERWIASRPRGAPEPTAETQSFVAESRHGATRRRNILTGSLAAGLVAALVLAGLAYWQRGIAVAERQVADQQRQRAEQTLAAATETANNLIFDLAQRFEEAISIPVALRKDILDRARKLQEQLNAFGPDNPDLQRSEGAALDASAAALLAMGDATGAFDAADRARQITESLLGKDPSNADRQRDSAVNYAVIGDALMAQRKFGDALSYYQKSLALAEQLATAHQDNPALQQELSADYNRVGEALQAGEKLSEALDRFRAARVIAEKLALAEPNNAELQYALGISHERMGNILRAQGDAASALIEFEANRAILDRLIEANRDNSRWLHQVSVIYRDIAEIQVEQKTPADALPNYVKALDAAERLAAMDAANPQWQQNLALLYGEVGDVLQELHKLDDALTNYRKALACFERLATAESKKLAWQHGVVMSHAKIADALLAQRNREGALDDYRKALDVAQRAVAAEPENVGLQWDLLNTQWRLASLGDDASGRYQLIVTTLTQLRDQNKLRGDMAKMLAAAEVQLPKASQK